MFIYKIYSESGEKVYVGSTIQTLNKRFIHHKSHFKSGNGRGCSSYVLFEEYGAENCKIQLLEECEQHQRYDRERYWIETIPHTVNIMRKLNITNEERKQHMCDYSKKWNAENPEAYTERMRRNAIQQKEKQRERYDKNISHIREQASAKVMCECGIVYRHSHRNRHQASVRHQNLMKNKS
jgi:group I intron endonuclease